VAVDDSGQIYQSGLFCGTKTFGGATMTATTGGLSTFVTSYTAAAQDRWGVGGSSWNSAASVELFPQLISGYLLGIHNVTTSPNYGNGFNPTLNGTMDSFLLKIDPQNGAVVGMHPLAGAGVQSTSLISLAADGKLILAGRTESDMTVGAGVAVNGVQGSDVFVARIANPF
jgi:hypothetical protein